MLKLTKFASLGSMLLSVRAKTENPKPSVTHAYVHTKVGAYSMFFGVPYAVGMVGLLLVHEV